MRGRTETHEWRVGVRLNATDPASGAMEYWWNGYVREIGQGEWRHITKERTSERAKEVCLAQIELECEA